MQEIDNIMSILNIIYVLLIDIVNSQICPNGWSGANGKCYTMTEFQAEDWGIADTDCRMLRPDAHLVSFKNEMEAKTVIEEQCAGLAANTTVFWTGLNDLDIEAKTNRSYGWSFSDGTDPTYILTIGQKWWNTGQPNNRFNSEDCVAVNNGFLDDKACTLPLQACC